MEEGKTVSVEGKALCIEDMLLESSHVPTLIERVRFKTDIGDVTWKPNKREVMTIEADGFKIKRQRDRGLYIPELPKILYDIRDHLDASGPVTIKTDYQEWDKTPDQVYYFFNDEQIGKMKIEAQKSQQTKGGDTSGNKL